MHHDHPSRELALCLMLSIVLHLAAVIGLASTSGLSFGPRTDPTRNAVPGEEPIPIVQLFEMPPPPPPVPDPRDPNQIKLGDENSTADSTTWLGFAEETPHAAEQGEVEQPALTRDPSAGGASVPPVPAIPAVDPTAVTRATTEPPPPQLEQPAPPDNVPPGEVIPAAPEPPPPGVPEPVVVDDPSPEPIEITNPEPAEKLDDPTEHIPQPPEETKGEVPESPTEEAKPDQELAPPDPEELPPDPEAPPEEKEPGAPEESIKQSQSPGPAADQPQPTPTDANLPPAEASAPQQPVAGGEGDAEGEGSDDSNATGLADDRESDASSIENFAVKELGKPLAARGLKIITTKPRLSYRTQIMGWGVDPVVRIYFASDGRVREMEFLQESGNPDIDRPVKDALFYWRAEGKALAALGDPLTGDTISVDVRIIR